MSFKTLEWKGGKLFLIDQTALPAREIYLEFSGSSEVADAIRDMIVRGAPAIGVTAGYGLALGAREVADAGDERPTQFDELCEMFAATRPTAVNLFWAIKRMRTVASANARLEPALWATRLEEEAVDIHAEDVETNKRMGKHGQALLPDKCTVLTHCNAGALATAGYGTALGVIRAAKEAGKDVSVIADETRPFFQGARLTAWELMKDDIPVTLITDNMAGYRMAQGGIDAVVVGADRIAANGDVANKIGTYSVAVMAKTHGIPFYVAAPRSTIDMEISDGSRIPIEERTGAEVTSFGGTRIAPEGIKVWNPGFDVTPAKFVTGIITEEGVASFPYIDSLANMMD